jgi:hypothetical protein
VSDPERQWIARLESEKPVQPEEIDETPLGRVREVVGGTAVVVGGMLGLLGVFAEDARFLRIAALAVLAVAGLVIAALRHRQGSAIASDWFRPARERPSRLNPTSSDPT